MPISLQVVYIRLKVVDVDREVARTGIELQLSSTREAEVGGSAIEVGRHCFVVSRGGIREGVVCIELEVRHSGYHKYQRDPEPAIR